MKQVLITLLALMCIAGVTFGQHAGCPAHEAAERGHTPFDVFHKVMSPTWHGAWPDKDYDALIKAGPEFEKTFVGIAKMNPTIKSEYRKEMFESKRTKFAEQVEKYATAAKAGDGEALYKILPDLHTYFEETAGTLIPIKYKHLEGLAVVTDVILTSHLPEENEEGIEGSTETLLLKMVQLTEESIPAELESVKEEMVSEFAKLQKSAQEMKKCCDKKDMKGYKKHTLAFQEMVTSLIENYL